VEQQGSTQVALEEIEQAICQMGDIKAARVVASSYGAIQEIHVLALPTKSPKQLVRDVESLLMARFGISVDHKKISIAQLGEEIVHRDTQPATPRAKIDAIQTHVHGVNAQVTVGLEFDEKSVIGQATGPASQTGRLRLVALATLDAVQRYLDHELGFALEDVAVDQLGRERVAVCCVVLVTPLGEQAFAGSAMVRQNENDSIVRATLDAINRRLGFLTTP
jgi:hypothetical protein